MEGTVVRCSSRLSVPSAVRLRRVLYFAVSTGGLFLVHPRRVPGIESIQAFMVTRRARKGPPSIAIAPKRPGNGAEVKDVREVLRQKEEDCARLRKEIEALRLAAPLLQEDADVVREEKMPLQGVPAGATQAVTREQDSLRETAPAGEQPQSVREPSEDTERKGPLSANLNESSWWRRKNRG
jgi:hypothetical protein